jgi:hypothetical protein
MFNFIFKKFIDNVNKSSVETLDFIEKQNVSNINLYEIISFIPHNKIMLYILISIIFFIVFRSIEIKLSLIFGIIILGFLLNYMSNKDHNDKLSIIKDFDVKTKFLTTIMYDTDQFEIMFKENEIFHIKPAFKDFNLHKNELLIELFYNIRSLYVLCPSNYISTLLYANYIIGLHEDLKIGVNNPFENLTTAYYFYKNALNSFESSIHSIEDMHLDKFNKSTYLLQSILLKVINQMIDICKNTNDENGLTTQSIPNDILNEINSTTPDDTKDMSYMPNYNYF